VRVFGNLFSRLACYSRDFHLEGNRLSDNRAVNTIAMTIHKKGAVSNAKGTAKNELATSSTSSDMMSTETYEVVSSTSVVEESRQMMESEIRSSAVEMTSASREVIMDSKGNIVKVIETPPQTIQRSSSSQRSGKSSQDFIAGEQMRSIKQAKTAHEIAREGVESRTEDRNVQGKTTGQSVQMQSQSESHSTVQQSVSSSSLKSSTSENHSGRKSTVSSDIRNEGRAPVIQTSSRSSENTRVSSETSEAVTRDGQTVSSTTRILETGEKINDNGKMMSTSSREIDTERTVTPSNMVAIGNTDDIERSGDKDTRSDSKSARSNVEISSRCNKPGQSTWDGTFVYEKPSSSRGKSGDKKVIEKSLKDRDDRRDSETSVKVTQEASAIEEISVIDQVVSSTSTMTRDSKTIVDEGQLSTATRFRDSTTTSDKVVADMTDLTSETHAKGPVRYSRPGDSAWDGSFVMEKPTMKPKRRNDSDVFHRNDLADNVVETTQRTDFREKSTDGTYEKESSETVRVVKGATDNSRFISEERRDVSRESSIHIDESPSSSREERPVRDISGPSQRRVPSRDSSWNGEFISVKPQDNARKRSSDVTVVRRTEKEHDSVDVQDVTEEQNVSNVSESVSTSYIVEYAISSDKRNIEKITSVSDVIPEEEGPDSGTVRRQSRSPERQPRSDTTSRCYKPGQSTWDGTFVYERPLEAPRRAEDKRATRIVDIRDVTEDNSINEADITSTSYIVEHSSSQQSFSDVRDASLTSTIYETVVHEGRPVETTIRFNEGTSRSKVSTTERQTGLSPRPGSPEKPLRDKDAPSTKPGSSTWDGTFVPQRSHEKTRPPSTESTDKPHRSDIERTLPDTSRGHVEEIVVDLRNITREKSSTSDHIMDHNSVVMEQSEMHESYADSSNVDFSMTSLETVIIRDGQPITKTISIQEGPHSPARRLTDTEAIITTDVKESTVKSPEKKKPQSDDRAYRPAKPGSSTWDGSFVYEKPETKSPADRRTPKDAPGIVDKRSPIREKPDITDHHSSITISDTSRDVRTSSDRATSSVTIERTFIGDSKTQDTANVSRTFIEDRTENYEKPKASPRQRPSDDSQTPKDEKPQKSPVDRAQRPSKPGASTWDGSFVYEKPQDTRRKPSTGGPAEKARKSSSERKPIEQGERPTDGPREKPIPIVRGSTDEKLRQDVADISRADITRTSEVLQRSSYVIDQSASFTSIHDVRNVADERVITEFTKDTRKDAVSNSERHEMVSLLAIHAASLVS